MHFLSPFLEFDRQHVLVAADQHARQGGLRTAYCDKQADPRPPRDRLGQNLPRTAFIKLAKVAGCGCKNLTHGVTSCA